MTELQRFQVGAPWPYPAPADGLLAAMDPGETGLDLMLAAFIPDATPKEVRALTRERIRVAVVPSDPLVWFALAGDRISLDAPYGVGLSGAARAAALVAAARLADGWTEHQRGLLTLAVVDSSDGIVRGLRGVTLSRGWWRVLANALAGAPSALDRPTHDAAVARDAARWPNVATLIRAAAAVEVGGRV